MHIDLEALGERIAEQAAHLDAAHYRLLVDVAAFDTHGGWHVQGAKSCAAWLSWRVGWDLATARDRLRVAHKLVEFPATASALRTGALSYSKVRAMTRVLSADNEATLLECAPLVPAAQLEKVCALYRRVAQEEASCSQDDDRERRFVRRRDREDGMIEIQAVLHPEEAELVWRMLTDQATRLARGPGTSDPTCGGSADPRGDSAATSQSRAAGTDGPATAQGPCAARAQPLEGAAPGVSAETRAAVDAIADECGRASTAAPGPCGATAPGPCGARPLPPAAAAPNVSAETRVGVDETTGAIADELGRAPATAPRACDATAPGPCGATAPPACDATAPCACGARPRPPAAAAPNVSAETHAAVDETEGTRAIADDFDRVPATAPGPCGATAPGECGATAPGACDATASCACGATAVRACDATLCACGARPRPPATAAANVSAETHAAVDETTGAIADELGRAPATAPRACDATAPGPCGARPRPSAAAAPNVSTETRVAPHRVSAFDRADALVHLAQAYLRGESRDRAPIDVVLTIPLATLQERVRDPLEAGWLGDTAIGGGIARRLCCDAGVIELIEDADGTPLSVARKQRTISGSLKRALHRRDGGCTFPGCTHRLFLEGHHIRHWIDGGETSLENSLLVCSHHHRCLHEYGFSVRRDEAGRPCFLDPHGRPIAKVPRTEVDDDVGWPAIERDNAELEISADSYDCAWDGRPVRYAGLIDCLVRADGL